MHQTVLRAPCRPNQPCGTMRSHNFSPCLTAHLHAQSIFIRNHLRDFQGPTVAASSQGMQTRQILYRNKRFTGTSSGDAITIYSIIASYFESKESATCARQHLALGVGAQKAGAICSSVVGCNSQTSWVNNSTSLSTGAATKSSVATRVLGGM